MNLQVKGAAPTLISATEANKLIQFFNAFQAVEITPAGTGTVLFGEDKIIFDFSGTNADLAAKLQTIQGQVDALTSLLSIVTAALANATIVCNSNGTISLTFPGIAPQPLT